MIALSGFGLYAYWLHRYLYSSNTEKIRLRGKYITEIDRNRNFEYARKEKTMLIETFEICDIFWAIDYNAA